MSESRVARPALPFENPPRLLLLDGPERELLEQARIGFRRGLDERRAFRRLEARMSGPLALGWRWPLALTAVAAAVWFLVLDAASLRKPQLGPIAAEAEAQVRRPGAHATPELGNHLAEGATQLRDGSVVTLERRAVVSLAEQNERQTRLGLELGAATFHVAPQKAGKSFTVRVGPYEMVAIGTVFSVNARQSLVELIVAEGRVAVKQGDATLATFSAGQSWSAAVPIDGQLQGKQAGRALHAELVAEPAAAPASSAASASAADETCKDLVRRAEKARALECWSKRAQASGLSAEVATIEIARLKRGDGDVSGAIATLGEYRARFPQGSLQGEVALELVELYAGARNTREALAESEKLLTTGYGRERAEQLHWLRGNLYRDALRDWVRAQAEYEQINPGAKQGAEALYFVAVCLEQRGQREAARNAYEQYSRHPRATRKAAALQKVEQLAP